jgi:AcrR family transcriptional regulator
MPTERPRGRGRPRDEQIDDRVTEAARELLVTNGFAGATIQAIARRAGVHSQAIYRRWPTRIHLIEEAVFSGLDELTVKPTGDLRRDLGAFAEAYRVAVAQPAARVALPALISIYQTGADRRPEEDRAWRSVRPQFRAILEAAPDELVNREINPDEFCDFLLGGVLFQTYLSSLGMWSASPEVMIDILCQAVSPPKPIGQKSSEKFVG